MRLRLEEATAAAWTDAELDDGINQALADLGARFPIERELVAAVSAGATTVALPTDATVVIRVIEPGGAVLERRQAPRGSASGERLTWEVWAGKVRFSGPLTAGNVTVWYRSPPALAELPSTDDAWLIEGGCYYAWRHRLGQLAKRGDAGAGERTLADTFRADYQAVQRRRRRVRVSLLDW